MKNLYFVLFILCSYSFMAAQDIVDHRMYQSPVKNQVNRGTCTAFAILAALETFPGFPNDLSEQYLYGLAKATYYKKMEEYGEGAQLKFYIEILEDRGTLSEAQDPYNPKAVMWNETDSDFDKMKKDIAGNNTLINTLLLKPFTYKIQPNMYIYRYDLGAKDVDWIKAQLDEGLRCIPVSYAVNSVYWSSHIGSRYTMIDPDDFLYVSDGIENLSFQEAKKKFGDNQIFNKLNQGELEPYYTDTIYKLDGGHAVSIVGYDENGFLIKNSWGTDWADNGYGWVSFDYHRLFANEILSLHLGKVHVYDAAFEDKDEWSKDEFWVKSLPMEYSNESLGIHTKGISISIVYHGSKQMPAFDEIVYKAYDAKDNLLGTFYGTTHGIFDGRETGYNATILQKDPWSYPTAYKLKAKFTTKSGRSFTNNYYNITAENQEYPPR